MSSTDAAEVKPEKESQGAVAEGEVEAKSEQRRQTKFRKVRGVKVVATVTKVWFQGKQALRTQRMLRALKAWDRWRPKWMMIKKDKKRKVCRWTKP